jgi:hypothetical protein
VSTTLTTTKWVLVKQSDGSRGQSGKKKIYEITLEGNKVTMVWGMAEKPQRQSKVVVLGSTQEARWFALDKKNAKVYDRGYALAYEA